MYTTGSQAVTALGVEILEVQLEVEAAGCQCHLVPWYRREAPSPTVTACAIIMMVAISVTPSRCNYSVSGVRRQ
jgi:hypothetical protein